MYISFMLTSIYKHKYNLSVDTFSFYVMHKQTICPNYTLVKSFMSYTDYLYCLSITSKI